MDVRKRTGVTDEKKQSIASTTGQNIKRLALKIRGPIDYTPRFGLFMLPCVLIALALGGKFFGFILFLGAVSSFIFNNLQIPWGVFCSVWFTLLASEIWLILNALFLIRHTGYYVFLLFNIMLMVALVGMIMSLQFQFIQNTIAAAKVFERALFSTFMYPSSVLLTWAVITISGLQNAAYYYLAFLSVAYYCFGTPTKSAFRLYPKENLPAMSPDTVICNRLDNFIHTLTVLFLPGLFYISIYHRVIFEWFHLSNLFSLYGLGSLLVGSLKNQQSLWWTGLSDEAQNRVGNVMIHSSICILILCVQYRVIFTSFYNFIQISPPFSYIFVGISLYALYAALAFHIALGPERIKKFSLTSRLLSHVLAFFGSVTSSYVLGLPWYLYFSPIVGSQALMAFYFNQRLMDWIVFVASLMIGLAWFMKANFMFLFYPFYLPYYGFVSVYDLSVILMAAFFFSLTLPGFVIMNRFPILNTLLLILHSGLVVLLEWMLHKDGLEIYPSYLVVFTSLVGIYVFYRTYILERIGYVASIVSCSMYFAKVSIIITYVPSAVFGLFIYCLSLSELLLYYTAPTMHPLRGLMHLILLSFGSFMSLDVQREFFHNVKALDFLLPNSSLVLLFLGLLPLTFRFFGSSSPAYGALASRLKGQEKRMDDDSDNKNMDLVVGNAISSVFQKINLFCLGLSLLATFFSLDIIDIITSGGYSGGYYVLSGAFWQLVCLCLILAAVFSGVLPVKTTGGRLVACVGVGLFGGLFLPDFMISADLNFPPPTIAYVTFPILLMIFLFIVAFIIAPSPAVGGTVQGLLFAIVVALYPILYFIESEYVGVYFEDANNFHMGLAGFYIIITGVISLVIKATATQEVLSHKRNQWMIYISNASTVICVLLGVYSSFAFFGGSALSLPFILPFLLLLEQDNHLFSWLTENRRYFPIVLSLFLVTDFMAFVNALEIAKNPFMVSVTTDGGTWIIIREFLSLFLVAVPQFFIIFGSFTHPVLPSILPLVLTLPLAIVALVTTSESIIRVLAVLDIFIGVTLWVTGKRSNKFETTL